MLVVGCWLLVVVSKCGCWLLGVGCWLLFCSGCLLLVVVQFRLSRLVQFGSGCWLLFSSGCWLLVVVHFRLLVVSCCSVQVV